MFNIEKNKQLLTLCVGTKYDNPIDEFNRYECLRCQSQFKVFSFILPDKLNADKEVDIGNNNKDTWDSDYVPDNNVLKLSYGETRCKVSDAEHQILF